MCIKYKNTTYNIIRTNNIERSLMLMVIRVFSYRKYKNWLKRQGLLEENYSWAKDCEGIEVKNGTLKTLKGTTLVIIREWTKEVVIYICEMCGNNARGREYDGYFMSNSGIVLCDFCADYTLSYNRSIDAFVEDERNKETFSDDELSDIDIYTYYKKGRGK